MIYYYTSIIILISILYSETNQKFNIEFLGINAAQVNLQVQDIKFNYQNSKQIIFSTNTINLTNYIFNVNNHYTTITSYDLRDILSFEKETYQPSVSNQIQTFRMNGKTTYNNSTIEIPPQTFNIFSLLYFISKNKLVNERKFNIEREGLHYNIKIIPLDLNGTNNIMEYELILTSNHDDLQQPVIKNTDIFTWGLFRKDSKKYITIDYNRNEIVNCIFDSGLIKMIAKNINYIDK